MKAKRRKIIADVFGSTVADRPLADEPLTEDDWRRVYELKQGFVAAVRQIVAEARLRTLDAARRRGGK